MRPLRGRVEARYVSTLAYVYAVRPLVFTPQNLTTAIYLLGTLLAGIASFVACGRERGRAVLVRTLAVVGITHALTGFASVVIRGTPADIGLSVFRNAVYSQLDQSFMGFARMIGLLLEPQISANYGHSALVFLVQSLLPASISCDPGAGALHPGAPSPLTTR